MSNIRVLLLSTDLERGGLPLRLVHFAKQLPSVGIEPWVGCLAHRGPLSQELENAGIKTFACDAAGIFDVGCFRHFAAHVRRINPDLIHSFLFHANMVARLFGRLDRARPIITSTVTIEIERRWHRWLEALTSGSSDAHVANSEAVATHLRDDLGFPANRLVVIPNAVDLAKLDSTPPANRETFGLPRDVPLIVWAGRMDRVKNLKTFIHVVARLRQRRPIQALILGDGPERSRIKMMVENDGLTGTVHMPGWNESVASWLKAADVLLFPSLTEGSPNVVLEAMACGCPVIASDIPACAELIQTNVSGVLCRPMDEQAFAQSIEKVLDDPTLRAAYIDTARSVVEAWHKTDAVVGRWRALYQHTVTVRGAVP